MLAADDPIAFAESHVGGEMQAASFAAYRAAAEAVAVHPPTTDRSSAGSFGGVAAGILDARGGARCGFHPVENLEQNRLLYHYTTILRYYCWQIRLPNHGEPRAASILTTTRIHD